MALGIFKDRAIRICRNLTNTISAMDKLPLQQDLANPTFNPPQAKKGDLIKKLNQIKRKYKIQDNDLL